LFCKDTYRNDQSFYFEAPAFSAEKRRFSGLALIYGRFFVIP